MKTYRFIFKYLEWNGHGSKLIRAENLKEAKEIFNEEYDGYNIEITDIKVVK